MERLTAEQIEERDRLVFGESKDWTKSLGGTFRFDNMNAETARALLEKGLADPEDRQNAAPSFETITRFLEAHPCGIGFVGIGYVVSPERGDCRVTLEGVEQRSGTASAQDIADFLEVFVFADELTEDPERLRAWFD